MLVEQQDLAAALSSFKRNPFDEATDEELRAELDRRSGARVMAASDAFEALTPSERRDFIDNRANEFGWVKPATPRR